MYWFVSWVRNACNSLILLDSYCKYLHRSCFPLHFIVSNNVISCFLVHNSCYYVLFNPLNVWCGGINVKKRPILFWKSPRCPRFFPNIPTMLPILSQKSPRCARLFPESFPNCSQLAHFWMEQAAKLYDTWLFELDFDLKNDFYGHFMRFRTAKRSRILIRRENFTGTARQRHDNGTKTVRQRNGILPKRYDNGTKTGRLLEGCNQKKARILTRLGNSSGTDRVRIGYLSGTDRVFRVRIGYLSGTDRERIDFLVEIRSAQISWR